MITDCIKCGAHIVEPAGTNVCGPCLIRRPSALTDGAKRVEAAQVVKGRRALEEINEGGFAVGRTAGFEHQGALGPAPAHTQCRGREGRGAAAAHAVGLLHFRVAALEGAQAGVRVRLSGRDPLGPRGGVPGRGALDAALSTRAEERAPEVPAVLAAAGFEELAREAAREEDLDVIGWVTARARLFVRGRLLVIEEADGRFEVARSLPRATIAVGTAYTAEDALRLAEPWL